MDILSSADNMKLCLNLLKADTEAEVIEILEQAGFWSDAKSWRLYGNKHGNFSTIGNQQNSPDAALVEKIVNSVDAVLMGECWTQGVRPDDSSAPESIYEAVAQFFGSARDQANTQGHISNWSPAKRTEISHRITLSATGSLQTPSFTISDSGEGQSPNSLPLTVLSLDGNNKINVHFVQGKFQMGGSGALQFCGRDNLQLVISRRRPGINSLIEADDSIDAWGFTILRRENPNKDRKVSAWTYLSPVGADQIPGGGGVLSFESDQMPLFPDGNNPYSRGTEYGTSIKLYEYEATGFKSHILRRGGLLHRLDILLPEVALPFRLHECRPNYRGEKGSYHTPVHGLSVRLEDDKGGNLEQGFPTSTSFVVASEPMTAKVYAFKRGKAETYTKNEGVIFTVNGQAHGHLLRSFFSRKATGMGRLADSLLVIIDCSNISVRAREDLFMNSRDRLRNGPLRGEIERELEILIKGHQGLRELRESRRQEDVQAKLENSKPMKELLESIIKKSPSLAAIFGGTGPISNPFKIKAVADSSKPWNGETHPTFFKFKSVDYGQELIRQTASNQRARITFETDVSNDYFDRLRSPGTFDLNIAAPDDIKNNIEGYSLNLNGGIATLNCKIPIGSGPGDKIRYEAVVSDSTLVEPFVNSFVLELLPPILNGGGNGHAREPGKGTKKGQQRESPQGLAIPEAVPVYQDEWEKHGFDRYSALKVIHDPGEDESLSDTYSYYVNMDNIYLNTELKATRESPEILKARWQYGLILVGMAMLRDDGDANDDHQISDVSSSRETQDENTIEERVYSTGKAIAPILLPLIDTLGTLSEEDLDFSGYPE